MSNEEQIVIAIGAVLAVLALALLFAILRYSKDRRNERMVAAVAGFIVPGLLALRKEADTALVPLGDTLKPLHDFAALLQQYVDEPSDTPIALLSKFLGVPPEVVAEFTGSLVNSAMMLSDGTPEPPAPAQGDGGDTQ